MITKEEVIQLLHSTESSRVERTISTGDVDKFQEAICAFANDLPNSRQNGYLIIGAKDNGELSGLKVKDSLLKNISSIRSNGNILPLPMMNVERFELDGGDLLVVEVQPSFSTPVRYRGRTFVRIGPRRDIASQDEERILTEKRVANMASFDASPCFRATIDDLLIDKIEQEYIPKAVAPEILAEDHRDLKHQMASLGLFDLQYDCPTYGGIILFGRNPKQFMHGAYVQYGRFGGKSKGDAIVEERAFNECLAVSLHKLEDFIEYGVCKTRPVFVSAMREEQVRNYPQEALRELIYNAVMHRDYQSNMPTRFYSFNDRIEIMNPGGLYGKARPENFPFVNDYRNPIVAEGMKVMGFVNMFNHGVQNVKDLLKANKNPEPQFNVDKITVFEVVTPIAGPEDAYEKDTNRTINQTINRTINRTINLSERQKKIIELVSSNPAISQKDMADILSVARSTLAKDIQKLIDTGFIQRTGARKNGLWIIKVD